MESEIVWRPISDDIEDDCVADWQGLMLRAEDMGGWFWWAVYDHAGTLADCYGDVSSRTSGVRYETMAQARAAAERAARRRRLNDLAQPLKQGD